MSESNKPPTLHERVARQMANSHSVGPYASYDFILERLRSAYPTEEDLRALILRGETWAKMLGAPSDFEFLQGDKDKPLQ